MGEFSRFFLNVDLAVFFSGAAAVGTITLSLLALFQTKAARQAAEASQEMVEKNRRMVEINSATLEEMKVGREAQERPFVTIELDYAHAPMLYVLIRNSGRGPAKDVEFNFSPKLETPEKARPRGGDEYLSSETLPILTEGIGILPPGARISLWWGPAELIIGRFYDEGLQRNGIRVKIFYESLDGQLYEELTSLNPAYMEPAIYSQPPSVGKSVDEFAEPLAKAAKKLSKAIEDSGVLRIQTATEKRIEEKARWQNMVQLSDMARQEMEQQQDETSRRQEHDEPPS